MTSPSPRLRVQAGLLLSGRGVASAVSALWMIIAARSLSITEFADLGLLLSLSAIAGVVADLGYPVVLTRLCADNGGIPANLLRGVLRRRLSASLGAAVLLLLGFAVASTQSSMTPAFVFCGSLVATAAYSTVSAALRGVGRVGPEALNEVASRILVLGAGWWLLQSGGGLLAAAAVYVVVDLASAVVLVRLGAASVTVPVEDDSDLRLRSVLPIGAASLLAVVYYRIDVWLLGVFSDGSSVARYVASYRVLDGLLLPAGVIAALVVARIPTMPRERQRSYVLRLTAITSGLIAAVAAVLAPFGATLLGLTFGEAYRQSPHVLMILLLSAPAGAAVMVLAPVVSTEVRHRIVAVVAFALGLNVALNLVVVPLFGATGAAAATFVSQVVLAGLLYRSLPATPEGA